MFLWIVRFVRGIDGRASSPALPIRYRIGAVADE